MKSSALGSSTSAVEVSHISSNGLWLLARDKELFLPYNDFHWFKDRTVAEILQVEEPTPGHFYWPQLDVDLTLEIIENPQRFPLKSKSA